MMSSDQAQAAQVVVSAGDDGDKPVQEEQRSDGDAIRGLEEAILSAEENLHRSVVHDGPSSPQTRVIATDLVLKYNHLGVRLLSENDIKGSLALLQKAKLLTSRDRPYLGDARLQARAVTLNNFGCLMKKWGKPRVGIAYLARALKIEAKAPGGVDNPAGTHANMSAALSTLGMHRAAAVYAVHAVGIASRAMEQAGAVATAEDDPAGGGGGSADHEASVELPPAKNSGGGGGGGDSIVQNDENVDSVAKQDGREDQEEVVPLESNDDTDPGVITVQQEASIEALSLEANRGEEGESRGGRAEDDSTPAAAAAASNKEALSLEANRGGEGESRGGRAEDDSTPAAAAAANHHDRGSTAGGLLAIAYFNLAVEREHLGQPEAALEAYEKARAAAALHLDPDSPVAQGIELALETASNTTLHPFCTPRAVVQSSGLSFPSIGKLYFGPKPQGVTPRVSGLSPRRLSPRRQRNRKGEEEEEKEAGDGDNARLGARQSARQSPRLSAKSDARESLGQSPLERAYLSQQPSPPSDRDRRARAARLSRKSPPSVVGPGSPGPQRAGRWARDAQELVPPQKALNQISTSSGVGGGTHGVGGEIQPSEKRRDKREDDLLWRALACAEWGCSPDDARRAQQLSGRDADGRTANVDSPKIAFALDGVG